MFRIWLKVLVLTSSVAMVACAQETPMTDLELATVSDQVVASETDQEGATATPPNFILMIGDDMAVETLSCYGIGNDTAETPNLDKLCSDGVRFDNFWSQPVCSPTRATLLTGQYGFRNGVGTPANGITGKEWLRPEHPAEPVTQGGGRGGRGGANNNNNAGADTNIISKRGITITDDSQIQDDWVNVNRNALADNAYAFPQALKVDPSLGYSLAALGKWHLANDTNGSLSHPLKLGFDHYSGSMRGGGIRSYFSWSKVIDGVETDGKIVYATTDVANDAISWIDSRDEDPWFLWVAFNAPHTPFHLPPVELLNSDAKNLDPSTPDSDPHAYYNAMIEAMDTEIGRILASMDDAQRENTYVVFMGDNGTPGQAASEPFGRQTAKGTMYQGGVNVPFMVVGPGIESGRVSKALANSVDMFATVLELAGTSIDETVPAHIKQDSVSLVPILHGDDDITVRDFAYADAFGLEMGRYRDQRTIRNVRYKLIYMAEIDLEEFYDLENDPFEQNNLLEGEIKGEAQENYIALGQQMAALRGAR
jgi:arylsulfatase A-like enzyme